uniref:Uncharacterized protein n=1 Tax=Salix viminalis TaxID=40686 RepID=A0A6N2NDA7_SALVM
MMWSSIENLKQNLNKIALDVHDEDDELEMHASSNGNDSSVCNRRNSHRFAHSKSVIRCLVANGNGSPYNFEIEQYKAQIKRLQESEVEIKALSINYAAILKEKEDQISRLNQENGSFKQNLDATKEALNVSRTAHLRISTSGITAIKGSGDQSPKRPQSANQAKSRGGNQIQNGLIPKYDGTGNGILHDIQPDVIRKKMEAKKDKDKNRSFAAMQATHELQIKELRTELEKERNKLANIELKLQEEQSLNKSFQEDLRVLNTDRQNASMDVNNIHDELNDNTSEIRRLQIELSRWEDADPNDSVKNLKRVIVTLEKENANLKMEKNNLEAALQRSRNSSTDKTSPDEKVDSTTTSPRKEEVELLLQKLERDLKESCHEKDKALRELARLKQHLLEKESEESEKMDEDSKIIEELC